MPSKNRLVNFLDQLTAPPASGAPIDYVFNPLGSGMGLLGRNAVLAARGALASSPSFARSGIEQGVQNPDEGITDPKTGRKIPTLQAFAQKVPHYDPATGKTVLANDSPLPEPLPQPGASSPAQWYGDPNAQEPNTTIAPKNERQITTEKPVAVSATMIKSPQDLGKVIKAAHKRPVIISDASDLGFTADKVVVIKGDHEHHDREAVLNSHLPPVVSQKGIVNHMRWLWGSK